MTEMTTICAQGIQPSNVASHHLNPASRRIGLPKTDEQLPHSYPSPVRERPHTKMCQCAVSLESMTDAFPCGRGMAGYARRVIDDVFLTSWVLS
jgi:hypothetical protein